MDRSHGTGGKAAPPRLSLWAQEPLAVPKLLVGGFRRPAPVERKGAGRPVMVIPGMLSGDGSTRLLRRTLTSAGYDAQGWGEGFNNTISPDRLSRAERRLTDLADRGGKLPIIVGWSLGGFYARALAQRHPELVSMVVTLGTPFSGDRHANNAWRLYEFLNDHPVDAPPIAEDPSQKPAVHTIAVWSRKDGIVAPECARGLDHERDEDIELPFRHFEMGSSKRGTAMIAQILNDRRHIAEAND